METYQVSSMPRKICRRNIVVRPVLAVVIAVVCSLFPFLLWNTTLSRLLLFLGDGRSFLWQLLSSSPQRLTTATMSTSMQRENDPLCKTTSCTNVSVTSCTKDVKGRGKIRYHFSETESASSEATSTQASACQTILIMGVGTTMSVEDYDLLSSDIVLSMYNASRVVGSMVVIISDSQLRRPFKNDVRKNANLTETIISQLSTLVTPICSGNTKDSSPVFIVGGHSASGKASFAAVPLLLSMNIKIHGFFGLDPFYFAAKGAKSDVEVEAKKPIILDIPSLYWGFSQTTCFVRTKNAALQAYELSNSNQRILYQIQNKPHNDKEIAGVDTTIDHCFFADNGCSGCTGTSKIVAEHVRQAVSLSFQSFVGIIQSNHQKQPGDDAGSSPFDGKRRIFDDLRGRFVNFDTKLYYNNDVVI